MTIYIAPIVEGHSEVIAFRALLYRIWNELLGCPCRLQVLEPARKHRDDILKVSSDTLEKAINTAFVQVCMRVKRDQDPASFGIILLLIDAEDACPAQVAPSLLSRAESIRSDARVSCVLPNRMFENWIAAGANGLRGLKITEKRILPEAILPPSETESIRGKNWIKELLKQSSHTYSETGDSEKLVRAMDLLAARASSLSFDKLCRELGKLVPPPQAPETPCESAFPE